MFWMMGFESGKGKNCNINVQKSKILFLGVTTKKKRGKSFLVPSFGSSLYLVFMFQNVIFLPFEV